MKASKGSDFEREICKRLSKWWSKGVSDIETDDIFWRSSQSGGRATFRAQKGLKTFGSYGDIAAVNPIGQPLLQMFTIELKRGDSHGNPFDLIECQDTNCVRPWEAALNQAVRGSIEACSFYWLLIHKRDHRKAMVYFDSKIQLFFNDLKLPPVIRLRLAFNKSKTEKEIYDITGLPLDMFLNRISPKQIIWHLAQFNHAKTK